MPPPPDVLFDLYFKTPEWRSLGYRGRHTLEWVEPAQLRPLLAAIQEAANEAFNSAEHIPQHVRHGPFHFDYIDSDDINAYAFRRGGFSFIGITIPLVYKLWELSSQLSRSGVVAQPSGVRSTFEDWCEGLRVAFFRIALRFVGLHEWTHHVHGHLGEGPEPAVFSEILDDGKNSRRQGQVLEIDADCYAAHHILVGLFDGEWCHLLNINREAVTIQDEVLFACFVVGIGALMFALSFDMAFDEAEIYRDPHPPVAARMNCLMFQAGRWRERHRPYACEAWMPLARFQTLMRGVAEAAFVANPLAWDEQTTFLSSKEGIAYIRKLDETLTAYKLSFQ